jgi:KDO II ethanolaminephosphotransferase
MYIFLKDCFSKYLKIFTWSLICIFIHFFVGNFGGIYKYLTLHQDSLFSTFLDIAFSLFVVTIFLSLLFSVNIFITKIFILIANFIALIYSYFVIHFGIVINQQILISALFFAEGNDVSSSFDSWIYVYCIPLFIVSTLVINFFQKKLNIKSFIPIKKINLSNYLKTQLTVFCYSLITIILLFLVINFNIFLATYKLKTVLEQLMPSFILTQSSEIKLMYKSSKNYDLEGYDQYQFKLKDNNKNKDPLIVVIFIGESLRSDRLSINGYKRETTPKIQQIPNLFAFKDVLSCATTTAPSLLCMLTDEMQDQFISKFHDGSYQKKYSVAKVFKDLNFDVTVLSNANKDSGIYNYKNFHSPNKIITAHELRQKHMTKINDFGDLILLEEINNKVEKNSLYVLGTRGSHREYYSNYPRQYAKFEPDLGHSIEEINNSYDNTVVYFDIFMDKLVTKLKNENAIIFYSSDHGESLGENNVFLHGLPLNVAPKEQRNIPMMIWMSDKFIAQNTNQFNALKHNHKLHQANKLAIKHDHLFFTIVGCVNFESSKIKDTLNLCKKQNYNIPNL